MCSGELLVAVDHAAVAGQLTTTREAAKAASQTAKSATNPAKV